VLSATVSTLYEFPVAKGYGPTYRTFIDASGNLHGGAIGYLSNQPCQNSAAQTIIFTLTRPASPGSPWTFSSFESTDAIIPSNFVTQTPFLIDKAGNMYTVSSGTGALCLNGSPCTSVIKLSPASNGGTVIRRTVLYSLKIENGITIRDDLSMDASGDIYGTTTGNGVNNCGAIFRITP
jgi:hypothetical protein